MGAGGGIEKEVFEGLLGGHVVSGWSVCEEFVLGGLVGFVQAEVADERLPNVRFSVRLLRVASERGECRGGNCNKPETKQSVSLNFARVKLYFENKSRLVSNTDYCQK